ncbi:MAG TPA: hypothetical protein VGM29_02225, partial [Polyangiaceae bacterium]
MFRPSSRVSPVFGAALLLSVVACSGGEQSDPLAQASSALSTDSAGGIEGTLQAVSVLNATSGNSMKYSLRAEDGSGQMALRFDVDPGVPSGDQIRVWGALDAGSNDFHVTRFERVQDQSDIQPLIGSPSKSVKVAWVQIDMGGGINQTVAAANALIFDQNAGPIFGTKAGNLSLVQYYAENSYGQVQMTGQVETPMTYTAGDACTNLDGVAKVVEPEVTALGRTYDHYYLYWGSEQNCGPGWGEEGTETRPGKSVWLNNDGTFCTATGQEIGHNFGLMHASTMACGANTISNDTSTCTSNEYGNPMTVMGGGCRHLNTIEKWYSGYYGGCNAVKVRSSTTITLLPIEIPCTGVQAIQIPMSPAAPTRTTTTDQSNGNVTIAYYYLELRGGQGLDNGLKPGVFVHAAPDIPAANKTGPRTFLLDMNVTNNTTRQAWDPMAVGQTFTDPAGGVSFTLLSVSATSASVQINIDNGTGANTCLDGSTLSGPGPASCTDTTGSGGAGGTSGAGGTGAGGAAGTGAGGTAGKGGTGAGGAAGSTSTGGAAGTGAGGTGNGGAAGSGTAGSGTSGSTSAGGASAGGASAGGASAGGASSGGTSAAGASAGGTNAAGTTAGGGAGASNGGDAGATA